MNASFTENFCKKQPMRLYPAYRSDADTPWGGNSLRELFGKDTPSPVTGESLEASVLPGLESRLADGTPLSHIAPDFPLLIKLIDARERLSIQVHPDDEYARANERANGKETEKKNGKTEAWVILAASPGASIVYGLRDGVSAGDLENALGKASVSGAEEDVMRCVNVTPVKQGDVFFIPPGTVHAIGAGIILYEIQQSSDITYRVYDYGRPRPLHIPQALACIRKKQYNGGSAAYCMPNKKAVENRLPLVCGFFTLERPRGEAELMRVGKSHTTRVLTPLCAGEIVWNRDGDGGANTLGFKACETILLPDGCECVIRADGDILAATG